MAVVSGLRKVVAVAAAAVTAIAGLTVAAGPAAAAAPATWVTMSGTGPWSAPRTLLFTPGAETLFTVFSDARQVRLHIDVPGTSYDVLVAAPEGVAALAAGAYEGAAASATATRPGLDVTGDGQACGPALGRFDVHEVGFDAATGKVSRLWLTYEQHCGGAGVYPALVGEVRWNAPPPGDGAAVANAALRYPPTYAGHVATAPVWLVNTSGGPLALDGATLSGPGAAAFRVTGTTCGASLGAGEACAATVAFEPTTPGASYDATLAFGTGAGARTAALRGPAIPGQTAAQFRSDPGDYVGEGRSYDFTTADSLFGARVEVVNNAHRVRFGVAKAGAREDFDGALTTPPGQRLAAGATYTDVWPDTATDAEVRFGGMGRGCTTVGTFTVHDAAYDLVTEELVRLVATFDQRCADSAAHLRGMIAWRAPLGPLPDITAPPTPVLHTAVPGTGSIDLAWTPRAGEAPARYVVRMKAGLKPASAHTSGLPAYSGTATSATVAGLAPGTAYTFSVYALDAAGNASQPAVFTARGVALTLAQSAPVVVYGTRLTLTATVRDAPTGDPLAGRAVALLARPRGTAGWTQVAVATVTEAGTATFAPKPLANMEYAVRVAPGWAAFGAVAGPATVLVRTYVTSALSKTTIARGASATLYGRVAPSHAGQRVYLQRYSDGAWRTVASTPLTAESRYAFRLAPSTAGQHQYRVVKTADADHVTGYAPARTLTVT